MTASVYQWFECFGIEIEYMIVDRQSLSVRPISDRILVDGDGAIQGELERGAMAWSNELLAHVIELKTNGPVSQWAGVAQNFQQQISDINQLLQRWDTCLMPTGMHPQMNPEREKKLWEHECHQIYEMFDRIFDCSGHGWANLQSMHLNLPFQGNQQFALLHNAIRLLLPILPGIAASSPMVQGQWTGKLDNRMEYYRNNSRRIPEVAGAVVPPWVSSIDHYHDLVLEPLYRALAPHDPEGTLRHEWCNARGAIARFQRNAIEIRVLDSQECPAADLAIAQFIVVVLKEMVHRDPQKLLTVPEDGQQTFLESLLVDCITAAEETRIDDRRYASWLGLESPTEKVSQIWNQLFQKHRPQLPEDVCDHLQMILDSGPLARRIQSSAQAGDSVDRIYRRLCECLANGQPFPGSPL